MDLLLSARFALHEQLLLCRNGARMTTGGLEPEPDAALVPNDRQAVMALQRALVDQGFSLGTSGAEGDGVDGGYGRLTADAVLAFKDRERLAQPGDASFDGVTSVGTMTRLDEIYRHELVDVLVAELAGTPYDPFERTGDLEPTEVEGLFAAPTAAGGRLLDAMASATYAPAAIDAAWQAEGGAAGPVGRPTGLPFSLPSGRDAMDFEGGRLIDDPSGGVVVVPRWAVTAATGSPFDLGEPVGPPAADPNAPAGTRVPHERGAAFADPDGNAFAFPDDLLTAWADAVAAGADPGMPTDLPSLDTAAGAIAFPFENTTLSIGIGAAGAALAELAAAAGEGIDHIRFIVPFPSPTPRPDQIRPPRINNAARHFVNGDPAFPEMVADIRAATAAGQRGFVYMANWWVRHDFPIPLAGGATTTLGAELLAAIGAGAEVRGMAWSGRRVPAFSRFNKPSVDAINAAGGELLLDGQVQFAGSHHQKLLICFDGETVSAWVGGIDWNEDRIRTVYQDEPGGRAVPHPGYPMVDDMVQVRGGGAHELLVGWLERWEQRTGRTGLRGRTLPGFPPAPGSVITQLSHTYGPGCPFSMGVSTAATTIEHVIRRAREFIYIEDQYFLMTERMERALMNRIRDGVTVIAVITDNELCELPFGRQARFDAIARVAGVSLGGPTGIGALNVFEPLAAGSDPVGPRAYTHCKVVIADDQAAVIGSVNSSNRSWTHDSEVATLFVDAIGTGGTAPGTRGFARQARCDLWSEHGALGAVSGDHATDVPAFLSGATSGGRLRRYGTTRPRMTVRDHAGELIFRSAIDPV